MDKSRILEQIRAGSVDPFITGLPHKDAGSPPSPPDYHAAALAQGAANVDTARTEGRMNNPNVYTPYGSQTVTWASPTFDQSGYDSAMAAYQSNPRGNAPYERQFITGSGGEYDPQQFDETGYQNAMNLYMSRNNAPTREQFTTNENADQATVTQNLTPAAQAMLDAQNRIGQNLAGVAEGGLNRVGQGMAQPFDQSNIQPLQADAAAREAAQKAAYEQQTSRLDPHWDTRMQLQRNALVNQGLTPGTEAYDVALRDLNLGRNDAYQTAWNNSFNTGLAAQQSDFGMQDQANTQNAQMQAYLRSLPLNELNALRTGAQVQNPQFQAYQGSNVSPPNLYGAAQLQGDAAKNIYNQQSASADSFNTGLMGMIGTAAGGAMMGPFGAAGANKMFGTASDRRLKSNIQRVGTHPLGIGIYEYDIFGVHTVGVMADELETVMPDAVMQHGSGYKFVDYGRL